MAGEVDGAVLRLELGQVVAERPVQRLGVGRGEDDPGVDLGLGQPGQDPREVDDDLGVGVGDEGEVGVDALRLGLVDGDLEPRPGRRRRWRGGATVGGLFIAHGVRTPGSPIGDAK